MFQFNAGHNREIVNMLFTPILCSLGIRLFWVKSEVSACAGSKASARCERGGVVKEQGKTLDVDVTGDAIKCAN